MLTYPPSLFFFLYNTKRTMYYKTIRYTTIIKLYWYLANGNKGDSNPEYSVY